jgi:hypothetical protein
MVSNRRMRDEIYVNRNFNLNRQVFTPATRRKELQQARVIRERRKQEENKNMSIRDLINARLKNAQQEADSIKNIQADTLRSKQDSTSVILPDSSSVKQDTVKAKLPEVD